MNNKVRVTAAVAALAVSFTTAPSFAKKGHKMMSKKCIAGHMMTGAPNTYGWGQVSGCGLDGKMYPMPTFCYVASGVCPR